VSGVDAGAGDFFQAVDAVGIACQSVDPGSSLQGDGAGEQEFDIAAPTAGAAQ
jgi:hypothetical protein